MANLDLKKELKHLYAPSANAVAVVDVPVFNYLVIDGEGNPNTDPAYARAIQALYPLAYGVRPLCSTRCASNLSTRVRPCRSYILGPTTRKAQTSRSCTATSTKTAGG